MAGKRVTLVGSTGSIGIQALDEIRRHGGVDVVGLSCSTSIEKLEVQAREFKPKFVAVLDGDSAERLKHMLRDTKTEVLSGQEGILDACVRCDTDLVVIASVGPEAFTTTVEAVKFRRDIAPASKEPFVFGSEVILPLVKHYGVKVFPIDSEHSAIWQCVAEHNIGKASSNGGSCIVGIDMSEVSRVWLGCSGGPFYGMTWKQLGDVTYGQARKHPTWDMGSLITINSATLYNKGQEISEARALFGLGPEQIGVTIDRRSMIHAVVEFRDGSRLMNLSRPDMHDPIRFALFGKRDRKHIQPATDVKIVEPDGETFRLLPMARHAMEIGMTMPAAMVGANGEAVKAFAGREVGFTEMVELVVDAAVAHEPRPATPESIMDAYGWGGWAVREMILDRHDAAEVED